VVERIIGFLAYVAGYSDNLKNLTA